jgi:hypothetical protein
MRLFSLRLLLLLSALTFFGGPARGACDGRLTGDTIAGGSEYDPFDAIDFRHSQSVSIRNTGSETCDFIVAFRRQPADAMLGPAVHYRLEDNAGNSLISGQAPPYSDRYLIFANVQAGQVLSATYYLVVPRGQFAHAGTYNDDDVMLLLFGRNGASQISAELDSKTLFVTQAVKPVVALNIAGGGLRTTLNFDTLTNGKERTVMLQTRANYAYSLALSSSNTSQLKLDPELPGQVWSIPYSLRVNNQPVRLQPSAILTQVAPQTSDGRESHVLLFRVEDIAGRRAGVYRDFVTVDIHIRP